MRPVRIAIIGFGKIAADQHVPAIAGNSRLDLVATSSRSGAGPSPRFTDWRQLLDDVKLDAVAITTPPSARYEIARECIERGLHVLMEKPPTVTLGEAEDLARRSAQRGVSLMASWHSRHNPAVARAADILANRQISSMTILWREDVEKWHPGQDWIWKPGGFGVFDPGINAFSIVTAIFPGELFVRSALLSFRDSSSTPIAADIRLASPSIDGEFRCDFDWRGSVQEEWTIAIATDAGDVVLKAGGSELLVDGAAVELPGQGEYPGIYDDFVALIEAGRSSVDLRPLRLVADCLLVGERQLETIHDDRPAR